MAWIQSSNNSNHITLEASEEDLEGAVQHSYIKCGHRINESLVIFLGQQIHWKAGIMLSAVLSTKPIHQCRCWSHVAPRRIICGKKDRKIRGGYVTQQMKKKYQALDDSIKPIVAYV